MCFAAIYFFCDPDYLQAVDGKFDAWNLAVQTFLTIGYGVLTPDDSWWAVLWGVCATLLAVFDVAIITGVPYIKFSKPRCKILFSTVVTVHMHEGVPTLTIRIANLHKTPIFNLSCTMYSVSMGKTTEGISHIKPVQLHLQTENILVFQDNFILQHRLDASSPLYQVWKQAGAETAEILETGEEGTEPLNLSIHVTVQGNDALLQDTVHARHIYHINDFRFDCHFDDMVIPESEHYGWEDDEKLMKTRWSRSASMSSVLDGQNGNQSEWETNHKGIGMPPRMVLACGRMDDTKVSVKHVNDLVIRKVADAMALHHLGEETYHGMLKADKERVRDSKLRSGNSQDLSNLRASGGGSGSGSGDVHVWLLICFLRFLFLLLLFLLLLFLLVFFSFFFFFNGFLFVRRFVMFAFFFFIVKLLEIFDGSFMSMFSCSCPPLSCFVPIFLNALSVVEHASKIELGKCVSLPS